MLGLSPTIWLIVHAALAAIAVGVWLMRVTPNLRHVVERRLLLEVWGPIGLLIPVVCGVAFAGDAMHRGSAWMPIAGPVLVVMFAFGIAQWRRFDDREPSQGLSRSGYAALVWTMTGVMLLMLTAAGVLNVLVGQCLFAIAAVVLWMNTPSVAEANEAARDSAQVAAQRSASLGVVLIVLLAVGQGMAVIGAGAGHAIMTVGIALAAMAVMQISVALSGPAENATRLAGWTATLGVLFALGVLSMLHMLPHAIELAMRGDRPVVGLSNGPSFEVAHGFEALAPEASGLIAVGLLAMAGGRLPVAGRRMAGAILALVSICLLCWRLL